MLENLYTTKMSANKKTLQSRFTKIRSKSGRISKIAAAVMSCAVAVTMLSASTRVRSDVNTVFLLFIVSAPLILFAVFLDNTIRVQCFP